ncbi:hypothetical protein ACLH9T_004750 [Salmonella enterica]|nr:hypothetical protein [Salmonella enterica]EBG5027116.1 hypothetical protein [Salmonella enterica subsp. enterica serovar Oranienburg]EAS1265304.1 hypothetical protein [Salmonella enterica]EBB1607303.1 hypothetical protein [Salmonella enterica]EBB9533734.1 hypothetical protein [Salmonella enterica]
MKVYMKDNRLWREVKRAMLVGLLCLPFYSAIAEPITPVTGGKMETDNSIPEGYRPLPVTEFVVEAEKNDTYDVAVGVEYSGKVTDAMDWIEKNVTGELQIYRVKDNKLIASYSFFNKKDNQPKAGAGGLYLNKKFYGETYSVSLDRGNYVILLRAFFKNDVLDSDIEPAVFISFNRFRNPWW